MASSWSFRGLQLDLARQMETLDTIHEVVEFSAGHGYNVLVLYLEGRVRTPSFPYPDEAMSYDQAAMTEVVQHAARKGIDVVPVVSNLGHAEHFFAFEPMRHLAELRGGRRGRFSSGLTAFCPSLPETYAFFEAYFRELAEVFPSPYFHVGLDEVWDIGYCEHCRARANGEEGQAGIFAQHVLDTHRIISGTLRKRMIVWDDMFELYPQALERTPRDVILCCCQYGNTIDHPVAHFANCSRTDLVGEYHRMGFDCVIGPRELNCRNITSLTQYAAPHAPLGGLVTSWEHATDFLLSSYPNIAYAGRLWSAPERIDDAATVRAETVHDLFPAADAASQQAVCAFMSAGRAGPTSLRPPLTESGTERFVERALMLPPLQHALERMRDQADALSREILADICLTLTTEAIDLELREERNRVYASALAGKSPAARAEAVRALGQRLADIHRQRQAQWQRHRPGVSSTRDAFARRWQTRLDEVAQLADDLAAGQLDHAAFLTAHYALPDAFSSQWVRVSVRDAASGAWRQVGESIPKPLFFGGDNEYDCGGYFRISYALELAWDVTACRFESWGHGGIGVRFVEVEGDCGSQTPSAVSNVFGTVDAPQNLLDSRSPWCFLGHADTAATVLCPGLARQHHGITVELAPTQ